MRSPILHPQNLPHHFQNVTTTGSSLPLSLGISCSLYRPGLLFFKFLNSYSSYKAQGKSSRYWILAALGRVLCHSTDHPELLLYLCLSGDLKFYEGGVCVLG
jgi:hypothetical protein